MSGATGRIHGIARIFLLAAGLLACNSVLQAQEQSAILAEDGTSYRATVTTEATYSFDPHAVIRTNRPGYVALFEVQPGLGAVMLYPHDPDDQRVHAAGEHRVRLSSLRMELRRELLSWHLGQRLFHAEFSPFAHLVAVVSQEPIRTERLASGRVFEAPYDARGAAGVRHDLVFDVLAGLPGSDWDAAATQFSKFHGPFFSFHGAPSFASAHFLPFLLTHQDLAFLGVPGTHGFSFFDARVFGVHGRYPFVPFGSLALDRDGDERPISRRPGAVSGDDGLQGGNAPGGGEESAETGAPSRPEPMPAEVRATLQRIADATAELPGSADASAWRRIEAVGEALHARGIAVDVEGLRGIRGHAEGMNARGLAELLRARGLEVDEHHIRRSLRRNASNFDVRSRRSSLRELRRSGSRFHFRRPRLRLNAADGRSSDRARPGARRSHPSAGERGPGAGSRGSRSGSRGGSGGDSPQKADDGG